MRIRALIAVVTAGFGIGLVPATARADTALMLGGTPIPSYLSGWISTPVYPLNAQYFAQYTFVDVPYPQTIGPFSGIGTPTMGQSVATGKAHLDTAIYDTSGPILVIGNSQGSLPTDAVRAKLENDPYAPLRSQLSFLVNGDPEQRGGLFSVLFRPGTYIPILDYTVLGPVESRYDTVVFTYEYDGIADFPDRPWNLLADLNALFGVAYRHAATGSLNPYAIPAGDITIATNSKGATTTTYLGRAEHLPLTQPLRELGVSADLVNAIDGLLRPIIDTGYSRNDQGPFRGPILSGGQLHWPPPDPPDVAVQQMSVNDIPSAAAIEDAHSSTEAANAVAAKAVEPASRPTMNANKNANKTAEDPSESTTAQDPETSVRHKVTKRRPSLNVVKDTQPSTKREVEDRVDAGVEDATDEHGADTTKADPPSAGSKPSGTPSDSGGADTPRDHEAA